MQLGYVCLYEHLVQFNRSGCAGRNGAQNAMSIVLEVHSCSTFFSSVSFKNSKQEINFKSTLLNQTKMLIKHSQCKMRMTSQMPMNLHGARKYVKMGYRQLNTE